MGLEVVRHRGAEAFLKHAEACLLENEDRNNLILSLAYERATAGASEPDAFFGTIEDEGGVVGCALRTPPHDLLLTDMPEEAVPVLVREVAGVYESIPAVLGAPVLAESIAAAWVAAMGGVWRAGMQHRLYRLEEVVRSQGVPGAARVALQRDVSLVSEWGRGFARETGMHGLVSEETSRRWIGEGKLFLWEDGAQAVSMAAARGNTPKGVRIGYVYTPPEQRRKGYASALVADLSQRMLDAGRAFCVLFTDLSNPTSNAIYQRLGYRPICDLSEVEISQADAQ